MIAISKDPHDGEPTVDLEPDLYARYVHAKKQADLTAQYAEGLKAQLILALGDADAGLVDGRKVVTFRPQNRYAEAQLRERYPDLTQHYVVSKVVETLDMNRLRQAHPEIVEQFRVRALKVTIDAD